MKDRFDLNRLFQWDKKIHAGGLFGYLQKCRKMTVSQSRELADERFASCDNLLVKLLGFIESKNQDCTRTVTWTEAEAVGIKRTPK